MQRWLTVALFHGLGKAKDREPIEFGRLGLLRLREWAVNSVARAEPIERRELARCAAIPTGGQLFF